MVKKAVQVVLRVRPTGTPTGDHFATPSNKVCVSIPRRSPTSSRYEVLGTRCGLWLALLTQSVVLGAAVTSGQRPQTKGPRVPGGRVGLDTNLLTQEAILI